MTTQPWNLSDDLSVLSTEELEELGVKEAFISGELASEQQITFSAEVTRKLKQLAMEHGEPILFTELVFDRENGMVVLRPAKKYQTNDD